MQCKNHRENKQKHRQLQDKCNIQEPLRQVAKLGDIMEKVDIEKTIKLLLHNLRKGKAIPDALENEFRQCLSADGMSSFITPMLNSPAVMIGVPMLGSPMDALEVAFTLGYLAAGGDIEAKYEYDTQIEAIYNKMVELDNLAKNEVKKLLHTM